MALGSGDSRWTATYAVKLSSPPPPLAFLDGELLLCRDVARVVLFDASSSVIDARYLREGEEVAEGTSIEFPAHLARVLTRPAKTSSATLDSNAAETFRRVPPHPGDWSDAGPLLVNSNGGRADPRVSPSSPAATATGPHGAVVSPGLSRRPSSAFDLSSILSHFWPVPRVSAPPPLADSFGWWSGKVGGDHRSFAQVVVSPSVAPSSSPGSSSTAIGERGGRFILNEGHRGGGGGGGGGRNSNAGRGDRGNRNLVWEREEGAGGGSSAAGANSGRWDAAAEAAQGTGVNQGGGSLRAAQQPLPQPGR
ncbi:hypothetical protein ACQ4PT_028196 [Festuca glaucescens]